MNTKHKSQSGINLVIETEGWTQVQASWRFYNNIDVTIPSFPAILSGLWVFMKMMNVLKIYDVEALFTFKEQIGDMMGLEI